MSVLASIILLAAQSADLPPCDQEKADQGIQSHLNQCAYRDYMIADRELNAQWRVTAAHMRQQDVEIADWPMDDGRPGFFDSLLEAQRAWLTYRDAHCRNEGYWARYGTMGPLLEYVCLAATTRRRTEELRSLAEWPE